MNDKNENLRSFAEMTVKEQRKIQSMGGKASVKARQKRKEFRELVNILLECRAEGKEEKELAKIGVSNDDRTQKMLTLLGIVRAAQKGDVKAFEKLEDLCGEALTHLENDGEKQKELLSAIEKAVRSDD